ncbi:glycosyltransferase [Patescibacteria group bacterium]|nr:glycosyltransferase [Patescibacteria group bacterium]
MHKNRLKNYYLEDTKKLIKFLVPKDAKTLIMEKSNFRPKGKYDFIVVNELIGDIEDVQEFFSRIRTLCDNKARILVTYYNFLWRPIIKFATFMGWRKDTSEQNWLDNNDIANLLELAGLEIVTSQKRLLFPIEIPILSQFVNRWIAPLPVINTFCLKTWTLAKLKQEKRKEYSVSIVVPARNEKGNIPHIAKSIPKVGTRREVIFIEGHSQDNTWDEIQKLFKSKAAKGVSIKAFQQKGVGKADAVRMGFDKAKGDILMILDADLTVAPKELPKFYNVLSNGQAEFANGSRLVYPMEKEAMNTLNILGNRTFSWLFTWILGQRFKDTLCGTKALFRKDYLKIVKNRGFFGDFDPFGDFDLIFGAIKQNLKIAEIPIRYRERVYGMTNIRRFRHGWLLLKMTWFAYKKFNIL